MAKNLKHAPVGIAEYPRITGTADTKFDADGVWRIKVRFDNPADVADILAECEKVVAQRMDEAKVERAEAKKKDPKKTFKPLKLADSSIVTNEETGAVTIGFKMKASGISKKTQKPWAMRPAVFDAAGQPLAPDKQVGGGSKVMVAYTLNPFSTAIGVGVSLRLEAVQVIELVEFGQGDAAQYGFKNETPDEEPTDDGEAAGEAASVEGAGESSSDDF